MLHLEPLVVFFCLYIYIYCTNVYSRSTQYIDMAMAATVTKFFVLCLLSQDYSCYRVIVVINCFLFVIVVIFYDPDFFLFLLSFIDNDYAGFVYV